MADPTKLITNAELQRARQLYERAATPEVIVTTQGPRFRHFNDYVTGLVRKYIHQDPDHSVGRVRRGHGVHPDEVEAREKGEQVKDGNREPLNGKVGLGWGIESATGAIVPPTE